MSKHFVLPKDEYQERWSAIQDRYQGLEKWQRDEVYYLARKRGLNKDEAWEAMINMPVGDLPEVVFVWDGISHDPGKIESVGHGQ